MAAFTFNHIHLYSRDPMATAQYYHRMFDAKIIESIQSDGQKRIDLDINGLAIFILRVPAETDMPDSPVVPHLGLDHFGFRVSNLDKVAADLKRRGAEFATEPYTRSGREFGLPMSRLRRMFGLNSWNEAKNHNSRDHREVTHDLKTSAGKQSGYRDRSWISDLWDRRRRASLLEIEGTGWDIGYAALFLASDEARFITGVVLPVDGGVTVTSAPR